VSRPARSLISLLLVLPLVYVTSFAKDKDPISPTKATTVGEFALKVLKMAAGESKVSDTITPEEAIARLQKAGLPLRGGPNDPLTDRHRSDFFLAISQGLMEKVFPPPSGFDACGSLPKVPDCLACCVLLPGGDPGLCGKACGQAHADQQHASPSGPGD